jgi:hypothetical protein
MMGVDRVAVLADCVTNLRMTQFFLEFAIGEALSPTRKEYILLMNMLEAKDRLLAAIKECKHAYT